MDIRRESINQRLSQSSRRADTSNSGVSLFQKKEEKKKIGERKGEEGRAGEGKRGEVRPAQVLEQPEYNQPSFLLDIYI